MNRHVTDYPATFNLMRRPFAVWWKESGEWHCEHWVIVEVDKRGDVLAFRSADAPHYDKPGVAYYRWFHGSILASHIQNAWDDDNGW